MRNLFVFTFLFVLANPVFGQKDVTIKTIDNIKRSIVPIVCGYIDEQKNFKIVEIAGTGFFVDEGGRFITDAHVLSHWDQMIAQHPCAPAIYIPDHGWHQFETTIQFQYFYFTVCATDSSIDLAVCQPIENPFTSKRISRMNIASVSFEPQNQPEGMPVAFTGFPLQSIVPITSKGFVGGFVGGLPDAHWFDYIIDKAAWPGASGSPLYLANGNVVGIMRAAGQDAGSGISSARGSAVILDFLSKNPYTEKQPRN
jgi:hypothetical protein